MHPPECDPSQHEWQPDPRPQIKSDAYCTHKVNSCVWYGMDLNLTIAERLWEVEFML